MATNVARVWFHRRSDENAGIQSPSRLWWREVPSRLAVVGVRESAMAIRDLVIFSLRESAMAIRIAIADSRIATPVVASRE